MDIIVALSGVGCFLGGTAAWAAWLSPRARAKRRAHEEDQQRRYDREQRDIQVHQALLGAPPRHDDAGALIEPGRPGLLANMAFVLERLDTPLLNGKGEVALATIARLDKRSEQQARRLTAIERELRTR